MMPQSVKRALVPNEDYSLRVGVRKATPEQVRDIWERIKINEDRLDAAWAARHAE